MQVFLAKPSLLQYTYFKLIIILFYSLILYYSFGKAFPSVLGQTFAVLQQDLPNPMGSMAELLYPALNLWK